MSVPPFVFNVIFPAPLVVNVAAAPESPIRTVSASSWTSPVPFGAIITWPLESVLEIVLPSNFKLSTLISVATEFVPIVTPSIAPPSISKAEPSISVEPAVNLPLKVKAAIAPTVNVLEEAL